LIQIQRIGEFHSDESIVEVPIRPREDEIHLELTGELALEITGPNIRGKCCSAVPRPL
jgi:hypothetical protein